MKEDTEFNGISFPNVSMYVSWFNVLFCFKLSYTKKKDKFDAAKVFEIDLGSVYSCGMNVQMLPECFVFCEFVHNHNETPKKSNVPQLAIK